MYVIRTDAECLRCGVNHEYVTRMCDLVVYTDYFTALWVAEKVEGSSIKEIEDVPPGISYTLDVRKGGRPDPSIPRDSRRMSRL
jgi:hypothetical protein